MQCDWDWVLVQTLQLICWITLGIVPHCGPQFSHLHNEKVQGGSCLMIYVSYDALWFSEPLNRPNRRENTHPLAGNLFWVTSVPLLCQSNQGLSNHKNMNRRNLTMFSDCWRSIGPNPMGNGEKCPCEKGKSYLSEKSGQRSSIHSLCAMQATDAFI